MHFVTRLIILTGVLLACQPRMRLKEQYSRVFSQSGNRIYLAISTTLAPDNKYYLLAAADSDLLEDGLTFCPGKIGECSQENAAQIPSTLRILNNGMKAFVSQTSLLLQDKMALTISGRLKSDSTTLKTMVQFLKKNSGETPLPRGKLCTPEDKDFDGYRYPANIPHCRRNVSQSLKLVVAAQYQIRNDDFSDYEFDHFIPLSIGGANAKENLWPQPWFDADRKDSLEQEVFQDLSQGIITQEEAIQKIKNWHPERK